MKTIAHIGGKDRVFDGWNAIYPNLKLILVNALASGGMRRPQYLGLLCNPRRYTYVLVDF